MTVALAAPAIPHSNTKINNNASIMFIITENKVTIIASFGLPDERTMALSPKNRCVNMLPQRMINIKSLAYFIVWSLPPKKYKISSKKGRVKRVNNVPIITLNITTLPKTFLA